MSNNLFIGFAMGAVAGMLAASKSRNIRQQVHKAEDAVKAKMCSVGSDICEGMNPENQDN